MAHRTTILVKRTYLHIAIITLLSAVLWLALSIYQSLFTPSEVLIDPSIRTTLNPKINEEVFEQIVNRDSLSNLTFVSNAASTSAVTINEINIDDDGGSISSDSGQTTTP